jgi:hypothetical protein
MGMKSSSMDGLPSIVLEDHLHLRRKSVFGLLALALCSGLLAACGSSGSSHPSNDGLTSVCRDISAVLSDGPDPGADPVGYALAQVKPLRAIQASDNALEAAIDGLASAYEQVVTTNDSSASKYAVTEASDRVNAICPGAAS